MKFRLADRFFTGKYGGKQSSYTVDIFPGCMKDSEKRALIERLDAGQLSPEELDEAFHEVVSTCKGEPKPFLEFSLPRSGIIMTQHGHTLNQYFAHMVENKGVARLVNTGRCFRERQVKHRLEQIKASED